MHKFQKKSDQFITAVQLDLDTEGFEYQKWGGTQKCKAGDWLVNNNGEVYTVDKESFAETYEFVSPGVYFKPKVVWAACAERNGKIQTKEGFSDYKAGDILVYNDEELTDGYTMSEEKFLSMYRSVV